VGQLKRLRSKSPNDSSIVGSSSLWSLRRFSARQYGLVVLGLLVVAGGILLFAAGASPFASLNADKGILANGATVQSDSAASDGKYVKFAGAGGGGSVIWKGDGSAPLDQQWASMSDINSCGVPTSTSNVPDNLIRIENGTTLAAAGVPAPPAAAGVAIHFTLQPNPVGGAGCYSGRTELNQGNPTKSGEPANHQFNPGDNVWIALDSYFPNSYPLNDSYIPWAGNTQVHQKGGCNTPPFGLGIGRNPLSGNPGTPNPAPDYGHVSLYYNNGPTDCPVDQSAEKYWNPGGNNNGQCAMGCTSLYHNQWYKAELHVDFELPPNKGSVDVYFDFNQGKGMQKQFSTGPIYTLYSNAYPSFSTIGLLHDTGQTVPSQQDLYIAGYTVATSQAAAEANAFGSQGP